VDEARAIIADVLEGAAATTERIGAAVPLEVQLIMRQGAEVARLVAGLVRTLGVGKARAALEELKRRVDAREGVITEADLAEDDASIDRLLEELYS